MGPSTQFDLDVAIATWRRFLASARSLSTDDLDELETHLRDEADALLQEGWLPEDAFREAQHRLGDYGTIEAAYRNIYWTKLRYEHRLNEHLIHELAMLKNYLIVAWRQLARRKVFTFINICGLVIGMATCLLILLFILNETRFDAFHTKADRIYRLNEVQDFGGMVPQHVALSMYPMGPTLQEDFSEIEAFTRIIEGTSLLQHDDLHVLLDNAVLVDPAIFEMFDFPLVQGDPATALNEPNSVVLTEEAAQKLFGDEAPVGKTVYISDGGELQAVTVTGLLADISETSHLQFDALYSISSLNNDADRMQQWGSNWLVTYLLLHEGARPEALESKFEAWLDTKREDLSEYYDLYLQPLRDVHLGSAHVTHDYRNYQKFDHTYVTIFGVLAFFVLVIATLNFTNISTALSVARGREVGVRKAVGAQRAQLARQFTGESVLQALIALLLAFGLAALALGPLNSFAGRAMSLTTFFTPFLFAGLVGGAVLVGLLAGLYPALLLSAVKPSRILKNQGRLSSGRQRGLLRSGLVVSQFAIAIALIAGTLITLQQLRFLQGRDVGFDRDQVVMVPMNDTANETYDALRQALTNSPYVLEVTASLQAMGNNLHQMGMEVEDNQGAMQDLSPSNLPAKINYLDFYGIEIVAGRGFSEDVATDFGQAFVVNQAFVEDMGWDEPLGKRIKFQGQEGEVIGVAKDFNFNSLHHAVAPLVISVQPWSFPELSMRIAAGQTEAALAHLEDVWHRMIPDRPFTFEFLDQHFARLYATEQQMGEVVGLIAILALFIACLGLFGLASLTVVNRTKEIGIRKALGASASSIVLLLSKNFAGLVGIAFCVAVPVAYFAMHRWLEGFAYRITLSGWIFLAAGLAALAIALLTVSYHALKAASTDPVKALRYE